MADDTGAAYFAWLRAGAPDPPTPGQVAGAELVAAGYGISTTNGKRATWVDSYTKVPFPLDVLPPALRRFIDATATSVCVHPDMVATFMLPVLGALIGNARELGYKDDWHERARIYAAVIADPGAKKSPALRRVLAPVKKIQHGLNEENRQARRDWADLPAAEQKKTPKPPWRQLVVDDTTIEALARVHVAHPRGVLLKRDELSGWLGAHGQYKGGRGDDRQKWLELWSESSMTTNRVSLDEPIVIDDPHVCLVGGIQPDKASALIDKDDDGLVYRFLLASPPSVPEYADTPAVPHETVAAYQRACERLYSLQPNILEAASHPRRVKVTPEGRALMVEHQQVVLNEKVSADLSPSLRGYWGKFEAYLLRLALILVEAWWACEETPEQLDEPAAHGAAMLLDYYKGQAVRVFGDSGIAVRDTYGRVGPRVERDLVEWLRAQGGTASFRDARRVGPLRGTSVREAKELVDGLAQLGTLSLAEGPRGTLEISVRMGR